MLSIFLLAIVSLSQFSLDTTEAKGTNGFYRLFVNQNKLCFQYQAGRNWSEPTKLDSGDISEYAVAVTPGDYLHIVWVKQGRVYYKTNIYPLKPKDKIQWERFIIISLSFTEPTSNLIIEVSDEWICVVWRVSNELQSEVWSRRRWLVDPPNEWEVPVNRSSYLK